MTGRAGSRWSLRKIPAISPLRLVSVMKSVSPSTGCRNCRSTISALARSERIAWVRSARIAPERGTSTIITSAIGDADQRAEHRHRPQHRRPAPRPAPIITMSSLSV